MKNIVLLLTLMIVAVAVISASALISYNIMQQAFALKALRFCYKSTHTGLTCFSDLSECENARLADKTSISDRCIKQR